MIAMVVMDLSVTSTMMREERGTQQLMSTFKLEVESDIEEEDDFEDDSL